MLKIYFGEFIFAFIFIWKLYFISTNMTIVTVLQIEWAWSIFVTPLSIICIIMVWEDQMREQCCLYLSSAALSELCQTMSASVPVSSMQSTSSQRGGNPDLHFFLSSGSTALWGPAFWRQGRMKENSCFPLQAGLLSCVWCIDIPRLAKQGNSILVLRYSIVEERVEQNPSVMFYRWRWCLPLGKGKLSSFLIHKLCHLQESGSTVMLLVISDS